jgi:hypothetical protein
VASNPVPPGPEAITAEWLTEALRTAGAVLRARVAAVDAVDIGQGRGFTGRIARLRLGYDRPEPLAPAQVVAKCGTADPALRPLLAPLFAREIRFYRELGAVAGVPVPRAYIGAVDDLTGASVLLLEDLSHRRVGDNVAGCSLADAELAVWHAARLHATWWEDPRLDSLAWLPRVDEDADEQQLLYQRLWPAFAGKYRSALPGSLRTLGARFADRVADVRRRLGRRPTTIAHGDFRLDNLFFGEPGDASPLIVADWQVAIRAPGVGDVAYLLGCCLPVEERRAAEPALLRVYVDALRESGVAGYDPGDCLEDYRLSLFLLLSRMVIAGAALDFSGERGAAIVATSVERCAAAVEDHALAALLA